MTQEEKDLLLKDLCGRLQNKVMIYLHTSSQITGSAIVLNSAIYGFIEDVLNNSPYEIKEIKPYLRSMSNMTEEEKLQLIHYAIIGDGHIAGVDFIDWVERKNVPNYIDWLNAHHFDYRGLIEKGLALEAPEDMYKN